MKLFEGGDTWQSTEVIALTLGVTYHFDIVTVNGELRTAPAHSPYITLGKLTSTRSYLSARPSVC